MMPSPEDLAPYELDQGIIYRLTSQYDLKVLPLSSDKVRITCHRKSKRTFRETWFERHFQVSCIDNKIRIVPTAALPYEGKPDIDPYTLGTETPAAVARFMDTVNEVVDYAGADIGEHVVRARLEEWRVASLKGDGDIDARWFDFLQAETAMAWSYPAYECDYITPCNAPAMRM